MKKNAPQQDRKNSISSLLASDTRGIAAINRVIFLSLIALTLNSLMACGPKNLSKQHPGSVPGENATPNKTGDPETWAQEAFDEALANGVFGHLTPQEEDRIIRSLFPEPPPAATENSGVEDPQSIPILPEDEQIAAFEIQDEPVLLPELGPSQNEDPSASMSPGVPEAPENQPDPGRPAEPSPNQAPAQAPAQGKNLKAPVQMRASGFWESRTSHGANFTKFTLRALDLYGQDMLKITPRDVRSFCPAFSKLNQAGRKHFWVKLISAIAASESSFDPSVRYQEKMRDKSGRPVISRGLLQISLESSKGYGCGFENERMIHHPRLNLECGVRILNRWLTRDGVISAKSAKGYWLGGAQYWSTLRNHNKSFKKIKRLVAQSQLCLQ